MAGDEPGNPRASRQEWWWTHQPLRRCYRRLERLWRQGSLFAFLDPALVAGGPVPRTSNILEGGVNACIKRMLMNHRGLLDAHRTAACEWLCYMKSPSPDPYGFIPADDRDATDDGDATTVDGAPSDGTGIEWGDLHLTDQRTIPGPDD